MNIRCHVEYIQNGIRESQDFEKSLSGGLAAAVKVRGKHIGCTLHADTETELTAFSLTLDYAFPQGCRLLLNGYQSWTDTAELGKNNRQNGLRFVPRLMRNALALESYGDYAFADYSGKRGVLHGFTYAYVRTGERLDFFGSLCEKTGFTQIIFDTRRNKIVLRKDCAGLVFSGEYEILGVLRAMGREDAVFDAYFGALGVPRPTAPPVSGYTSWYNHYENINAELIGLALENAAAAPFKPDVFQIDDGYTRAVGDWLLPDESKFPRGMAELCRGIHAKGMKAGLWLAPFVCTAASQLFVEHGDWLLRDAKGKPVKAGHNWGGSYALDFYNEAFRDYLRCVFDTVLNDWGFDLLKLDFLYACCILPQHGKTRGQVMDEAMAFIRECAGNKLLLGCGVPLASAFGRVDYCRIGCDVSLDWDDKPFMRLLHRERISTKNCIRNTLFRRQLNGRAFLNDPDVFLLRADNSALTQEQKRLLCTVNHLFGSLVFTSDDMNAYDTETAELLHSCRELSGARVVRVDANERRTELVFVRNDREETLAFDHRRGLLL